MSLKLIERGVFLYAKTDGSYISPYEALRAGRDRYKVRARAFLACYLHALPQGFSLPAIAKMLGYEDHTTVLHLLRRGHGHDGKYAQRFEPYWSKQTFQSLVYQEAPEAHDRPASDKLASDLNRLMDYEAGIATYHNSYGWEIAA